MSSKKSPGFQNCKQKLTRKQELHKELILEKFLISKNATPSDVDIPADEGRIQLKTNTATKHRNSEKESTDTICNCDTKGILGKNYKFNRISFRI